MINLRTVTRLSSNRVMKTPSPKRVASTYSLRRADLSPPLGFPGGPDYVVERIRHNVRNPGLAEILADEVEEGGDLDNPEAAKIYGLDSEKPPARTKFQKILLGPHAQYRMDLRGITVPEIRIALASFNKAYLDSKSRNDVYYRKWSEAIEGFKAIAWKDPRIGLVLVFAIKPDFKVAKIVTVYWEGEEDLVRKGSVVLPGIQTFVSPKSQKNLPSGVDREPDSATTPSSAMPGGGRDVPRIEYNTPDADSNIKPRTQGIPGDQYGSPTKYDYNMPTRRSMT